MGMIDVAQKEQNSAAAVREAAQVAIHGSAGAVVMYANLMVQCFSLGELGAGPD